MIAWGAIATHLRKAENEGFNVANLLTDAARHPFEESQDIGAVLAWRVEDKLDYWRTRAETPVRRPMEAVSDEALERLQRRAVSDLMRAQANAGQNVIFRSRLHRRPRNSGGVQTSMDIGISGAPCTELHSAQ
jgi:hypothetical protein